MKSKLRLALEIAIDEEQRNVRCSHEYVDKGDIELASNFARVAGVHRFYVGLFTELLRQENDEKINKNK